MLPVFSSSSSPDCVYVVRDSPRCFSYSNLVSRLETLRLILLFLLSVTVHPWILVSMSHRLNMQWLIHGYGGWHRASKGHMTNAVDTLEDFGDCPRVLCRLLSYWTDERIAPTQITVSDRLLPVLAELFFGEEVSLSKLSIIGVFTTICDWHVVP